MRKILSFVSLFIFQYGYTQIAQPVHWDFSTQKKNKSIELIFTAYIDNGWHIYSQFIEEGGPLPTSFTFTPSNKYELIDGVVEQSKPVQRFDKTFNMDIKWFENKATFQQKIKVKEAIASVKGKLEFMVCNDLQCLPPEEVEFSFEVKNEKGQKPVVQSKRSKADSAYIVSSIPHDTTSIRASAVDAVKNEQKTIALTQHSDNTERQSVWAIFLAGFLGGFAAILMPCIFPMLPFTISYFTKTKSKGKGIGKAILYGLSIVIIYVSLGLFITLIFGADALNDLATNGIFNFLFFILLIVFAASFLGAFEITLPSRWINKVDSAADRGGVIGIFFMAFVLSLVSFSCTGPIIGTLLVEAASTGKLLGPVTGMFGFSLALAIPFMLFAMFPSWLKALPKSGGWLNSVKVVLGFLELALALKFLSNVDLAYHWQWFDREVFLVLWIVIFGLMGFYLLGKLKLPHDSALINLSPIRLFLAIITLSFTLYMIPGLWGAPLKIIAAFLPPRQTQDFDLYGKSLGSNNFVASEKGAGKKYQDIFHAPCNLTAFFDYEEGMAYAREIDRPVMIDFTGHACVNCRKMETIVWPDSQVLQRLQHDYVLIQLYVDDKTSLPEEEQVTSIYSGKKIKTLGNKWSDFQAAVFHTNSQPYYVLLNKEGEPLIKPQGADYDIEHFKQFLDQGLNEFKKPS